MVRTQGGYRFRPRVRFSSPEMEEPGTSAAAGVHSPSLHTDTHPAVRAGNEPSYSGSARARLEKSLARAQLVS